MTEPSIIFKDRSKLSPRYIPDNLPHRENQLNNLLSIYKDSLNNIENPLLQVTQIVGGVGSGKTCTAIKFGQRLEEEAIKRGIKLKHIYVNGKVIGSSRYNLYRNILAEAAPVISSRSLSPEEMLSTLMNYLREENEYLLITFDEVDYVCRRSKEPIVYDLTRLNEINPNQPCHVLGVIFIARDLSFHKFLEPSELSTLGRGIIEFPQYTSKQVKDILLDRVELAFKPNSMSEEVLDFISDVATKPPINGDVRVALDLLLFSGNLAENLGFKRVLPDHVRRVYGETYPGITSEDIISLSKSEKLILLGLVRALKSHERTYVGLREIREAYRIVCEEYGIKAAEDIEEYLQDLIDRDIVDMKSLTELGISNVPTGELEIFLNDLLRRLKGELDEKSKH